MKRNTLVTIGIITVCVVSLVSAVWAQEPADATNAPRQIQTKRANVGQPQRNVRAGRGPGGPGGNAGISFNLAEIELSEEQKASMLEKRREFQINTAEIRQKLQFAQKDLRSEMRKDPVDQAKVDSLWAEITSLKQQLGEVETEHMLALRSILTPEQLEKLQKTGETARELRELKAELQEMLLASGEPDAEKLKQLQTQIVEKEVALEKERVAKMAERMASLPEDQREQFRQNPMQRGGKKSPGRR